MLIENGKHPFTCNPEHICDTINTLKLFVASAQPFV